MLPKRRQRERSGIERAVKRDWPKHRAFVKRHHCCVRGCEQGPIEFAHWRTAATAGTSLKSHDWHGISLCFAHHDEAHTKGHLTFCRKYALDWHALAAEFVRESTDSAMKETMRMECLL